MTDWTDGTVGGCVNVTGRISIWVKNLANVGNMDEGERGDKGWPWPSMSAVYILTGQSPV